MEENKIYIRIHIWDDSHGVRVETTSIEDFNKKYGEILKGLSASEPHKNVKGGEYLLQVSEAAMGYILGEIEAKKLITKSDYSRYKSIPRFQRILYVIIIERLMKKYGMPQNEADEFAKAVIEKIECLDSEGISEINNEIKNILKNPNNINEDSKIWKIINEMYYQFHFDFLQKNYNQPKASDTSKNEGYKNPDETTYIPPMYNAPVVIPKEMLESFRKMIGDVEKMDCRKRLATLGLKQTEIDEIASEVGKEVEKLLSKGEKLTDEKTNEIIGDLIYKIHYKIEPDYKENITQQSNDITTNIREEVDLDDEEKYDDDFEYEEEDEYDQETVKKAVRIKVENFGLNDTEKETLVENSMKIIEQNLEKIIDEAYEIDVTMSDEKINKVTPIIGSIVGKAYYQMIFNRCQDNYTQGQKKSADMDAETVEAKTTDNPTKQITSADGYEALAISLGLTDYYERVADKASEMAARKVREGK